MNAGTRIYSIATTTLVNPTEKSTVELDQSQKRHVCKPANLTHNANRAIAI